MLLSDFMKKKYKKEIKNATNNEIYYSLLELVKEKAREKESLPSKKKLYYISAEFLIGKLLSCNLINLGIYDDIKNELEENGKSIAEIEEIEPEASLGNGGLGRLAACFLDSIATLGLYGDGIGLNYHFGLFKQIFKNNEQTEVPDKWIDEKNFLTKTHKSYKVNYKDISLTSRMYDIDITGYNNRTNKLHLFDVESIDENVVGEGIEFDKKDIKKNLTLFLYPDDSDEEGRLLRIYQQYFMVSNAVKLILDESIKRGSNLYDLKEYAVIQINDTHPTLVIPELIKELIDRGIYIDEAIEIAREVFAYTNHTILAEALEKWPIEYLKKVIPDIVPIIEILDNRIRRKYSDEKVYIIDKENIVHMAHIDIHYSFSVNGVAMLHTEILKNNELNSFYKIYPQKFNNKTNGITFRRWLLHSNSRLAEFITSLIGDDYKKDANKLLELEKFKNDDNVLKELVNIKNENKKKLTEYLLNTQGIKIDENAIFDIQIKRLHEYKRQQLNALYLIHKYIEIKKGIIPKAPICAIFGAKAAPAYTIAQDIIHLILCLGDVINNDKDVNKYLNVVMVENYNVTLAEKLIPAADISEQISLSSKEASGTGNMKFMLNGAVTLGTEDGANVEIYELVGDENIYIFGSKSDEVVKRYKENSYNPKNYYENNDNIKKAVDFIDSDIMVKTGNKERLKRLKNELINKDWFMTFPDFEDYIKVKEKAFNDFLDRQNWAKKMLINISHAGYFSSDRTIKEYNEDIWHLKG